MRAFRSSAVVVPKLNHQSNSDGTITYQAQMRSSGRNALANLLGPLLKLGLLVSAFFLMITFLGNHDPMNLRGTMLMITLGLLGGMIAVRVWGDSFSTIPVHFDAKAITVGGKKYLIEHIDTIGWREFGNSNNGYGQVYIKYGAEEIPILNNLDFVKTEGIYYDVNKLLKRVGHDFNP